jgi:hypothetical protein
MKNKLLTLPKKWISLGLISGLVCLSACQKDNVGLAPCYASMFGVSPKIQLNQQLQTFNRLGYMLNPGVDTTDLSHGGLEQYEEQPYTALYMAFGKTIEREPHIPITNKCWLFDMSNLKAIGGYSAMLQNLERISAGELKIENIKETFDAARGISKLSFKLNGRTMKWELREVEGFFDTDFFSQLVDLTDELKTKGRFTFYDSGDQNSVVGYETHDGLFALRKATGLRIQWLK